MGKMVFPLFLLFLIGSFWYFHVTRTSIKAWMSSNFRQIRLLSTELAALEHLKHQCLHFFSVDIDPILFKVGGYIDMHNILHEFEFWQKGITDYGVSCPCASKNLIVSTFSRLLLIWSSLNLQVTKTCIKSWMSSNFGQIRKLIAELVALECLKNIPMSYNGKVMSPC